VSRSVLSRSVLAAAVALVAALACACASSAGAKPPAQVVSGSSSPGGFRGDQLSRPVTLSARDRADTFRSSAGGATTLARLQHDQLMLLYFGYTHCPDVCPTTMADLGQAIAKLPSIVQAHVQVVFVTADPARDTPAVMKSWLSHFDSGLVRPFVGLTSSVTQIDSVSKSVGVPLEPPVTEPNGSISVTHGAQTLAFVNGRADVLWSAGTSVGDYTHDINLLVDKVGSEPGASARRTAPASGAPSAPGAATARIGELTISGGYIPQPASPDVAAAYFTVANAGATPDTLAKVTTNVATTVKAMSETDHGATGSMTGLGRVTVPAHGSFRFTQGHAHLMLENPTRTLRQGDRVVMTITFARAGSVTLTLPVVGLTGPATAMPSMDTMPSGG